MQYLTFHESWYESGKHLYLARCLHYHALAWPLMTLMSEAPYTVVYERWRETKQSQTGVAGEYILNILGAILFASSDMINLF